jgi:hypothetical protein
MGLFGAETGATIGPMFSDTVIAEAGRRLLKAALSEGRELAA